MRFVTFELSAISVVSFGQSIEPAASLPSSTFQTGCDHSVAPSNLALSGAVCSTLGLRRVWLGLFDKDVAGCRDRHLCGKSSIVRKAEVVELQASGLVVELFEIMSAN